LNICKVSIPRSGFCLFIRASVATPRPGCSCFNPSVGILFVHTGSIWPGRACTEPFQSLGRDSVCSYPTTGPHRPPRNRVSIPRSGFCLFILDALRYAIAFLTRFNPSVGILFVHTGRPALEAGDVDVFQSLGRDSVCSYLAFSSPSWVFISFQSLGRDSVCSYRRSSYRGRQTRASFNPSVGILFVHTWGDPDLEAIVRVVSIPRSGFCLFILVRSRSAGLWRTGFQSLGRDSVCSYEAEKCRALSSDSVSIPRSGFCLFILIAVNP